MRLEWIHQECHFEGAIQRSFFLLNSVYSYITPTFFDFCIDK
nr:MAG TPA: hypothetical protein [Caudoviricetes sp.]